jgi:hypothetical protein
MIDSPVPVRQRNRGVDLLKLSLEVMQEYPVPRPERGGHMSPALAGWCRLHDSHCIQVNFYEVVIPVPRLIGRMQQTWP